MLAVLILVFYTVEPQWRKKATHVEEQAGKKDPEPSPGEMERRQKDRGVEKELESPDPVLVFPEAGLAMLTIAEMAHHHQV